jgi:hypothetical protein
MLSVFIIIEQAAWNKSSLILKNILQNTKRLQLLKKIIKPKIIYKSNLDAKEEGLVGETK